MSLPFLLTAFGAVVVFCGVVLCALYCRGDIRTGLETPFGKFFLEAKERGKKRDEPPKGLMR